MRCTDASMHPIGDRSRRQPLTASAIASFRVYDPLMAKGVEKDKKLNKPKLSIKEKQKKKKEKNAAK
jgi:molybdenum cofactor biosynthesis enzyme